MNLYFYLKIIHYESICKSYYFYYPYSSVSWLLMLVLNCWKTNSGTSSP